MAFSSSKSRQADQTQQLSRKHSPFLTAVKKKQAPREQAKADKNDSLAAVKAQNTGNAALTAGHIDKATAPSRGLSKGFSDSVVSANTRRFPRTASCIPLASMSACLPNLPAIKLTCSQQVVHSCRHLWPSTGAVTLLSVSLLLDATT